ncbi:MAG TPA: prenyltransferase/squalene oxidase repeat-containing protein [Solirubrobacterales bacterium]|jgi:energy-coupling factor transport system substrate-specific component|nr:prenyltransferase/squalene oxidase repeat-containing protein [Solirubrobacterales bacterium]
MSWQLVSFLILAGVLLGGFAWYERSRPPAQVVALVAALAALAIAGRIAFAAFPNVKPTTDIVIFAGYALGPAAGFAVGALAALVSNFWFGQGPWTPWQMAAWGLCGILGAALALGTRNVGRLTLAAVCGLAAVGYGAILNFSLMATYGGELSWERFGILEGRAIPFEVAHAAGNVVFALVAGPAMIRMLIRFRERFEWQRTEAAARVGPRDAVPLGPPSDAPPPAPRRASLPTGGVVAVLLAVLLLGAFASTRAEAATTAPGPKAAAAWLVSVQNEDGGYGESKGAKSSQEMTGWAMLGLEAAGVNPQDVTSAKGKNPVGYLQGVISTVQSPGDLARTILALEGAGIEPREFGGRNLVAALLAKRRKDGSYEDWPNSTAYAVLALRSAGIANVADSLEWLREVQNEDGGWGDDPGTPSNADGTGAVLQALSPSSKAAQRGVGYLRQVQQKGGGFRLGGNGALNTQSTAWAVEGLLAAGADPAQFKRGGKSAYDYLEDNQAGDGHYRYSAQSDQTPIWVTGEVLVATSKKYLPLEAPPRAPQPKQTPTPAPTTTPEPVPLPESGGVTPVPNPTPVFPEHGGVGSKSQGKKSDGGTGKKGRRGGAKVGGATAPPGKGGGGAGGGAVEESSGIPPLETGTGESFSTGIPKSSDTGSGSGGSVLGSIVAGLLVGCLLFALGYGPYRRWQKNRGAKGAAPSPPQPPPGPQPPQPPR